MKTILISFLFLFLVGCAVPVQRTFPTAPEAIKVSCPDLQLIQPTTKLSEVVTVVTNNYSQYQECQLKMDAWIEWYDKQKDIFNSVK